MISNNILVTTPYGQIYLNDIYKKNKNKNIYQKILYAGATIIRHNIGFKIISLRFIAMKE